MRTPQLEGNGLRVHFDGVTAVDGVDLKLRDREILGLIGPNGAGKTTMLNVLSGFLTPTAGTVNFKGLDVTTWTSVRRARAGLVRTFQGVKTFSRLSVFENVMLGAISVGLGRNEAHKRASGLLERIGLSGDIHREAGSLAHGEERLLGIARALAAGPTCLLLDEPAAGLNEEESAQLAEVLVALPDDYNLSLLVVEHDMRLIMGLCHRIQVIDRGQTISIGTARDVQQDPTVQAAYLGARVDRA